MKLWSRMGGGGGLAVAWLLAAGCGGGGGGGLPGGTGGNPFDLPTVISSGGPVLAAPKVQPIYFPTHRYAAQIDDFLGRLAASSYWTATAGEYGVGPLTVLPSHTSSGAAPASISVTDIPALFAQVMTADSVALGAASTDTAYLLLFPESTTVTMSGQALCQDATASGYHTEAQVGGTNVALIVIPFCASNAGDPSLTGVSVMTPTISHELVETATDPFPASSPGYLTVDEPHAIWAVADSGGELADLCENETPSMITPGDIGVPVSRIWSNAAVAAGTPPCVPTLPGEAYFIAIPTLPDSVQVQRNGAHFSVPALRAAVGAAVNVKVAFHSQSTSVIASWGVAALEYHSNAPLSAPGHSTAGSDGQILSIAVTTNLSEAGVFPLIVASGNGTDLHFWFGTMYRQ